MFFWKFVWFRSVKCSRKTFSTPADRVYALMVWRCCCSAAATKLAYSPCKSPFIYCLWMVSDADPSRCRTVEIVCKRLWCGSKTKNIFFPKHFMRLWLDFITSRDAFIWLFLLLLMRSFMACGTRKNHKTVLHARILKLKPENWIKSVYIVVVDILWKCLSVWRIL